MTSTTDLPRPRFARTYMRMAGTAEERGATDHRRRLLAGWRARLSSSGPATD